MKANVAPHKIMYEKRRDRYPDLIFFNFSAAHHIEKASCVVKHVGRDGTTCNGTTYICMPLCFEVSESDRTQDSWMAIRYIDLFHSII